MLVLTRKVGESLFVDDDVKITVISMDNEKVRIGIDAPQHHRVFREELLTDTRKENRMATESEPLDNLAFDLLKGIREKERE